MKIGRKAVATCLLLAASVLGLTGVLAATQGGRSRTLPIVLRFTAPDTCELTVADQQFRLPQDEARFAAAMHQLRRRWNAVHIVAGVETSYSCVGRAIFIAQGAGFKKVGFDADPPEH